MIAPGSITRMPVASASALGVPRTAGATDSAVSGAAAKEVLAKFANPSYVLTEQENSPIRAADRRWKRMWGTRHPTGLKAHRPDAET